MVAAHSGRWPTARRGAGPRTLRPDRGRCSPRPSGRTVWRSAGWCTTPSSRRALFKTESDRAALRRLIETYLLAGGFEMQVNVVSRDTLLAA